MTVKPEISFDEIKVNDYDALAIPGGFEEAGFYEDAFNERFLQLIREFDEQKKIIAAVCVAAIPIGKSGVLKGRKGTTYDLLNGKRRKQLESFGVLMQDQSIVIDDNIITSTGPSTGLAVAFTLLEMLTDKANVNEVKRNMRFDQE